MRLENNMDNQNQEARKRIRNFSDLMEPITNKVDANYLMK